MSKTQTIEKTQARNIRAKDDDLNLRDFVNKYFISLWYLYFLFAIVGIALAYLYAKSLTPVYEVKSRLLIKADEKYSVSSERMVLEGLNLLGPSENVVNEIQILSSYYLMRQVVDRLGLEIDYSWKTWIATIPAFQEFPVLVDTFSLSPLFVGSEDYREGSMTATIKPINYSQFELYFKKDQELGPFRFGELIDNEYGKFRFSLRNPTNIMAQDSTIQVAFRNPNVLTENYLKSLQVGLINKEGSLLELSITDVLPERGKEVLQTLVEIYNDATIADKNEISKTSLQFVNQRLNVIKSELNFIEGNLQRFKQNNRISADVSSAVDVFQQEMSKYTEDQKNLEVEMGILESMSNYLSTAKDYSLIPTNLTVSNTALNSLIDSYNKLIFERQQLLETAQASNPIVLANEQQLSGLKTTIVNSIVNSKSDLEKKLSMVQNLSEDLSIQLRQMPSQERGLVEIKRQQVIKEDLYLYLLKKKEETALALIATNTPNSRVVDVPRASIDPIKPKKSLIYLGGLMGGLFLPFLFVIVKDFLEDSIKTEQDVKMVTSFPIIGRINKAKAKGEIVVKKNSRTAIAERFRLVRTNLLFLRKKEQKVIMVTSGVGGEGKSFVTANLAMSFALTNYKTVVIGMDLRKPTLGNYFGVNEKAYGVSEYLEDKANLADIIQETDYSPYLVVIRSGAIPLNPNELLSGSRVGVLFERLQKEFDVIIIDTPPICLVSDALVLNEYVTNTLYVVRSGITKKHVLEESNEIMQQNQLNNVSIILNGLPKTKKYGYTGSYGYYNN